MRILLPFDGSPASLHAVRHTARHSDASGTHVSLLNVQRVYVDAELAHAGREMIDFHRRQGEAELRRAADILESAGIEYDAHVRFGPVAEVIAQASVQGRHDAIVMGTRARHPLVGLLTRSVPSRVLRRARVPVVLLRHEAGEDAYFSPPEPLSAVFRSASGEPPSRSSAARPSSR